VHRMRRIVVICSALAALCLAAALATFAAAAGPNVTGTWRVTFNCTTGPCMQPTATDTITFSQAPGSSTVTGQDSDGHPVHGTLTGSSLTVTGDGVLGFDVTVKATVSADGRSLSGTFTDTKGTSGTATATLESAPATPVLGQSVASSTVSGQVEVEQPGTHRFVALSASTLIAVGTIVNATHGRVEIVAAGAAGSGKHSGQFYGGEFVVGQSSAGLTTLTLTGGVPCAATAALRAHRPSHKQQLWGDAHGDFQTIGSDAAATELGTTWLTKDTCSGTVVRVTSGAVRVRDLTTGRSVVVRAPHRYVAAAA